MAEEGVSLLDQEMQMLKNNRTSGYNYRYRRVPDWDENYSLYRDKVIINRLTQTQSANLPIMKGQIKTLLKDVDDMPVIYFENLNNDKQAELFKNEYWKWTVDINKMELQDIVDKRQVMLFGRSFDQWQIVDGRVKMTVQDPMVMLVSRYCDPFDLNSSRFLIHMHNFVPLTKLSQNPDYDKAAVAAIAQWTKTKNGLVKTAGNQQMLQEQNQKMIDMGVPDVQDPVLGETYVELTLHFVYRDDEKDKQGNVMPTQIFLYVECEDMKILMKKPLEEVIGVTKDHYWRNHYPYCSWADDLERQDFWSDSVADVIRTPNKILNSWFSQMVINRTLRNFGMHYFNSNLEGFVPPTIQPLPGAWIGLPIPANTDIRTVMQKVEIPELSESLDEITFLIGVIEKATGASAGQQGAPSERQITLGEFKATLTEAKDRVKGMSKFYTPVWKQRGEIFAKLVEAAPDKLDAVEIHKKGKNTDDIYTREIGPKDWRTPLGYRVKIWSQEEKDSNDINTLQKQNAVKTAMPDNPKVAEIYQRKLLEWAGYTPDDINEIMQFEQDKRDRMLAAIQAQTMNPAGGGMSPDGSTPLLPSGPTPTPGEGMTPPTPPAPVVA